MSLVIYRPIVDAIWFYLFVIAVLEALAIYLWQFRRIPGALPQVLGQSCKGAWLLLLVLASVSQDLSSKVFWLSLQQMSQILLSYIWYVFISQISGQKKFIPSALNLFIRGMVVFLWLVIASNSWHCLYWREVWLDGGVLTGVRGPASWLAFAFCYGLILFNIALGIRWIFISNGLRRKQAFVILFFPIVSAAGHVVGLIPGAHIFSPHAVGFLLSGIYITLAYRWWLIYSILPQAQKTVIENMMDGLLIVDDQDYIVDMNPAAKKMLAGLPVLVGSHYHHVVSAWPALAELEFKRDLKFVEVCRADSTGHRYYQLNTMGLKNVKNDLLGKIIVIKDITRQKQEQIQLMEQQKAIAILAERDRLGREIHDGPAQLWSYVNMEVEAIRTLLSKKELEKVDLLLENLAGITRNVHVNIRESIAGLQIAATKKQGFLYTLEEYLQWFRQNYELEIELSASKEFIEASILPSKEVQLLRIIQEALTNVRKHGRAHAVRVKLQIIGGIAEIRVEDDGCGFSLEEIEGRKGIFGLKIMRERAAEIGADVLIQSWPGAGTKIILHVPLEKFSCNSPDGKEVLP